MGVLARALVCTLVVSLPSLAAAAEPNPAADACRGKAAGAPCAHDKIVQVDGRATTKREPGTCQTDQCCALDYSSGTPPKSVCTECLVCKGGVAAPPETGGDTHAVEPPRAETGTPPAVEPTKRGCTIADGDGAPASFGLLVAVVAWLRGRGRRRHAAA